MTKSWRSFSLLAAEVDVILSDVINDALDAMVDEPPTVVYKRGSQTTLIVLAT